MDPATPTQPRVDQSVDIEASPDDVWHALTDPAELALWLDADVTLDLEPGAAGRVVDADGTVRQVLVTEVEPGYRLTWHWWQDGGEFSSVEITAIPVGDGTRVRVRETLTSDGGGVQVSATAGPSQQWARSLVGLQTIAVGVTGLTMRVGSPARW